MPRKIFVVAAIFSVINTFPFPAFADINSTPVPGSDIHVDRYSAVARGRHGQWVRASAALKDSRDLVIKLGLETDSGFFGIAGTATVLLKDEAGRVIATVESPMRYIAGKSPGKARRADFELPFRVPADVAPRVRTVEAIPNVKFDNAPCPLGLCFTVEWRFERKL